MQTNYKWIQYFQRPVPGYFTLRTGGVLSLLLVSGDQREKAGEKERVTEGGSQEGRPSQPLVHFSKDFTVQNSIHVSHVVGEDQSTP